MRRAVLSIALLGLLVLSNPALADDTLRPFPGAKSAFKKALRAKEPEERARAFHYLKDRVEVEAVHEVLWGFKQVLKTADKLKKQQVATIKTFDNVANKIAAADVTFRNSQRGPKDIARYNKATRKLEKDSAKARRDLRKLENAWVQERALLDSATDTLGSIFTAMSEPTVEEGLGFLREVWLGEKSTPEEHVRWMEALVDVKRKEISAEFMRVLNWSSAPMTMRSAAMQALAQRRDGRALGRAMEILMLPRSQMVFIAAAINALQTYHDERAISPLISFLKRDDIGRLRGDAHEALKSLTGETHGPYADPWASWWLDKPKEWKMPPDPVTSVVGAEQKSGVTFYGISTFSDRVLFIVDVSASMEWALGGRRGEPGGEKAKIVTARKEIKGAVYNLPQGGNFNVILFNHEVMKWNPGVVNVTASTQKKCAKWIDSVKPSGFTNIHDALEQGFRMVLRTTGEPDFDTIFFLTDGKPTAGKVQKSEQILERVKEWVAASNTVIHVIAIGGEGDIDEDFLKQMAKIGHGKYARRGD